MINLSPIMEKYSIEDQRYFRNSNIKEITSSLLPILLSEPKEKVEPKSITEILFQMFTY
ncbi:hypothetical protein [Candidatus Nitrosocosmicus sp. SS]|jgi:hypothetical protein|uniref:hypothetical protein n=1 Tax=Candidatus Nitrosocosmicus agrestis TaxID=2563600 RepID=UPI0012B515C0|nr:hypothetical protein [Candidatus Nitrosocosmicus sp. SS]